MKSILHKIKSFPRRISNRQLLAELLDEYPIEKQPQNYHHSLPIIKSPLPTTQPLLIASAFQQKEEDLDIPDTMEEEEEVDVFDYAFGKEITHPVKRRPTPYTNEEDSKTKQDEINELKKIVHIQKEQLDYLLSRSLQSSSSYGGGNNDYGRYSYCYDNDDDYCHTTTPYPTTTSVSHAIPIKPKKKRKEECIQSSHSMPTTTTTATQQKEGRHRQSLATTTSSSHPTTMSVPSMHYRLYKQQESKSTMRKEDPTTMYTTTTRYHHHQEPSMYTNKRYNVRENNAYAYSYQQYPIPYYYSSESSPCVTTGSSVPITTNYYYNQQEYCYPYFNASSY